MKRFLAVYTGAEESLEKTGWTKLSEAEREKREAAGMQAWMDWGVKHAGSIVDQGTPLGKTKRASRDGIANIRNAMTGYVIVEAESHEAAAQMFAGHPHFTVFPGDSVEIVECLPLPTG